ncbi:MAG: biopolymer transporter ExbD [Chlorobi bacterium]|nr:biopolymer transporter ExbD [Chlorobiota bacterium]
MNLRSRNKVMAEFNLASLTDVVFLLLIFFMLTSSFVAPNAIKVLLPKAKGQVISRQSYQLTIDANNNFYLDNKPVDPNQLTQLLAELPKVNGDPPVVVLRVDKSVPVEYLVQALDAGRQAGVKMILATKPK